MARLVDGRRKALAADPTRTLAARLVIGRCLGAHGHAFRALRHAAQIEVLGRAPLSPRQYIHLIRFGHKLLLVSLSPEGADTLTEITDPTEVDRLTGVCKQSAQNSTTKAFRQVFSNFSHERPLPGFVDTDPGQRAALATGGAGQSEDSDV